ncbi:hypothetical protein NDU88_003728 [Pleurodeles waltl]|uniref:Uncharacterized protein n=1 Tax=Pleurodeles waltl TaxID=8319 RepID=A0AAV7W373_PLEWA|nr:hypothetical protein NDU88_003728 [Pleurodeles waltl]
MLPQSDPPYPKGVSTSDSSDPEEYRGVTYPEALPGDGGQREQFRAVTRLKMDDLKAVKEAWISERGIVETRRRAAKAKTAVNLLAGTAQQTPTKTTGRHEPAAREAPSASSGHT